LSGNCLWGCHRQSLYSATQDLDVLRRHPLFTYRTGCVVRDLVDSESRPGIQIANGTQAETIIASKVLVGAGTLATTRLAMRALKINESIVMQSAPVAAFMLWVPAAAAQQQDAAFALAQLAFTAQVLSNESQAVTGFGSLFNVSGIPTSEFTPYLPMTSRYGIDALKILLRSCVVGNFYLPGKYTQIEAKLNAAGGLELNGKFHDEVDSLMNQGKKQLSKSFRKLGALMIPSSFKTAKPGADIHYGASLPMRLQPGQCETTSTGALFGLQNIHLIDGACLPEITEKPHTLTLMANADRISRQVVHELKTL
jgi:choline dehydrogenase-like flavoprotein